MRTLPPLYRHVIQYDWHRKFSLWERLQILFGFNLLVLIRIPCQHNPGSSNPVIVGRVTELLKPSEAMLAPLSDKALLQEVRQ